MSACSSSPTATTTDFFTTTTLTTSSSSSLTTTPGSTAFFTTTSCVSVLSVTGQSAACLASTTIVSTSTSPDQIGTVQVLLTVPVTVTSTAVQTLFGTSCSSSSTESSSSSSSSLSSSSSSITTAPSLTPTLPGSFSLSTPPPVTSVSATTLPDGAISLTTAVSQPPPSSVFVGVTGTPQSDNNDNSSNVNMGAVIGGALGGFFLLIGIVALGWFIIRRRRRWDDLFEKEDISLPDNPRKRFSLDVDDSPRPYQYGLVGHHKPPTPPPPNGSYSGDLRDPFGASPAGSGNSQPPTRPSTGRPSTAGSNHPLLQPLLSSPGQTSAPVGTPAGQTPLHTPDNSVDGPISYANTPPVTQADTENWNAYINSSFYPPPDRHATGSPTSFQEPRRLQVANATMSPTNSVFENLGNGTRSPVSPTAEASGSNRMSLQAARRTSNAFRLPSGPPEYTR